MMDFMSMMMDAFGGFGKGASPYVKNYKTAAWRNGMHLGLGQWFSGFEPTLRELRSCASSMNSKGGALVAILAPMPMEPMSWVVVGRAKAKVKAGGFMRRGLWTGLSGNSSTHT